MFSKTGYRHSNFQANVIFPIIQKSNMQRKMVESCCLKTSSICMLAEICGCPKCTVPQNMGNTFFYMSISWDYYLSKINMYSRDFCNIQSDIKSTMLVKKKLYPLPYAVNMHILTNDWTLFAEKYSICSNSLVLISSLDA